MSRSIQFQLKGNKPTEEEVLSIRSEDDNTYIEAMNHAEWLLEDKWY